MSGKNIWIGNLPSSFEEAKLQELLSQYGTVCSAKVITTVKGTCGLVQFEGAESAQNAVKDLHGFEIDGQAIVCRPARNEKDNVSTIGVSSQIPAIPIPHSLDAGSNPTFFNCNMWIGNLPLEFSQNDLQTLVANCGIPTSVKLLRDRATGTMNGAGMVNFNTLSEASSAIASLNGYLCPGAHKPLIAKFADNTAAAALQQVTSATKPTSAAMAQSTNVWVGNLPATYSDSDVAILFQSCGTITSLKLLKDKQTHISSGAAMINFSHPTEALAAVQGMNGVVIGDRDKPLIVKPAAAPKTSIVNQTVSSPFQHSQSAFSRIAAPTAVPSNSNIWAGNLPANIKDEDILTLFGACGTIASYKVLRNKAGRESEVAAMVAFSTPSQAALAIQQLDRQLISGCEKPLIVKFATPKVSGASVVPPSVSVMPYTYTSQQSSLPVPSDNVWVGNLPCNFTVADLNTLFGLYGTVLQSTILKKRDADTVSAGMVRFAAPAQAVTAVTALHGFSVDPAGPPLEVRFASSGKRQHESQGPAHVMSPHGSNLFHPYR
jgi:RNA recognition motif-containing protein